MDTNQKGILAVVALSADRVAGGGAPVFLEHSAEGVQNTAFLLEKILDATAHDLGNGTIILVAH